MSMNIILNDEAVFAEDQIIVTTIEEEKNNILFQSNELEYELDIPSGIYRIIDGELVKIIHSNQSF